jgi:hypothetical protein
MTIRQRIFIVALWLGIALVFFIGGVFSLEVPKYCRLARNGVEARAIVVAKEPDNHFFVRYSYEVDRRVYVGIGNVGRGNAKFEELKEGDSLRVYYDPTNPDDSLLIDPKRQLHSISFGVLFLTVVGSTFTILGLYAKGWLPQSPERQ